MENIPVWESIRNTRQHPHLLEDDSSMHVVSSLSTGTSVTSLLPETMLDHSFEYGIWQDRERAIPYFGGPLRFLKTRQEIVCTSRIDSPLQIDKGLGSL